MNRKHWIPLAMVLGFATVVPSRASADVVLPQRQCVQTFLSACATLHYVGFGSDGVLTLIVSNTSTAAEPNAYLRRVLFDLTGTIPELANPLALAEYGSATGDGSDFTANGDSEQWIVRPRTRTAAGVAVDLELYDRATTEEGGRADLAAHPGDAVRITITFASSLEGVGLACDDPVDCRAWTAKLKGLGPDGTARGYTSELSTVTPEPATVALLATGLVGLAGAGAARRRRLKNRRA